MVDTFLIGLDLRAGSGITSDDPELRDTLYL